MIADKQLTFIDFDRLIQGFTYPDLGVNTKWVKFPPLDGLPERTVFLKKIFGMKKNRAIIPHGHSNMVSAHLVLKGEFASGDTVNIDEKDDELVFTKVESAEAPAQNQENELVDESVS